MLRLALSMSLILLVSTAVADPPITSPSPKPQLLRKPVVKQVQAKPTKAKPTLLQVGGDRTRGNPTVEVRDKVEVNDNVERILLLSAGGPIIVETQITIDGQPFRIGREKLVDALLKEADTNDDGRSTWKEAAANDRFLPGRGKGQFQLKAIPPKVQLKKQESKLAAENPLAAHFDANENGLVDRGEARLLLAQMTGGAVLVVSGSSNQRHPEVLSVLDSDNDGQLSKAELSAAEQSLKHRDANNNDLLEAAEVGGAQPITGRMLKIARDSLARGASRPTSVALLLGPAADMTIVFQALQKKYAGNDGELTSASFPSFPRLIKRLDSNNNERLDAGEVAAFDQIKPHVILAVNVGTGKGRSACRSVPIGFFDGLWASKTDRGVKPQRIRLIRLASGQRLPASPWTWLSASVWGKRFTSPRGVSKMTRSHVKKRRSGSASWTLMRTATLV